MANSNQQLNARGLTRLVGLFCFPCIPGGYFGASNENISIHNYAPGA